LLTAGLVFLGYSFGAERLADAQGSPASWAAIIYQGVVIGAICFTVWMWQIRRYSASVLAIFGFIAPPAGVIISGVVLHETLTPLLLISAGLVAAGILVSNVAPSGGRGPRLRGLEDTRRGKPRRCRQASRPDREHRVRPWRVGMDFYEVIRTRRSVRRYRHEAIPQEALTRVLEAARSAPSGSNRQPTRFILISDPARKRELVPLCHNQEFLAQAPS